MKFLIIDSHKGGVKPPLNLHFQNAEVIAEALRLEGHGVDLIWSYPTVNDHIQTGYDVIVMVHASAYSFVDYAWLEQNPQAKLFQVYNEYNLGENRILWMAIKRLGKKYNVIANYDSTTPSKPVRKYIEDWHMLNLNCLVFNPTMFTLSHYAKEAGVYYGSYRKGREEYFRKYLDGMTVSTHSKNRDKFLELGVSPKFTNRIVWDKEGLGQYATSLYIEDTFTHLNYNHLANRFYEALNYNVVPLFDKSCLNTIELSEYPITADYIVDSAGDFAQKTTNLPPRYVIDLAHWRLEAGLEKKRVVEEIKNILTS